MSTDQYTKLYSAKDFPIFQNRVYQSTSEAMNCPKGDILLVQDSRTGLVHNHAFNPELLEYDNNYQNEQALSKVFQDHLAQVKGLIHQHFQGNSLIEVGCGKGCFLEMLKAEGFQITGFDPTYEGSNPSVLKQYFSESARIQADALILRHVLEHIKDPIEFLSIMNQCNGGGKVYIEVPCFDWIMKRRAWFDIFYEHVNYFRLSDFHRIFGRIHDSGHLFGGQYLYVVADLSSIQTPKSRASDLIQFPVNFLETIEEYTSKLLQSSFGLPTVIWGGSSKGVIFSLLMQRANFRFDMVVDINPAKQGRYLPSTGIRVYSPDEALEILPPKSSIMVMNSNYLDEVIEMTSDRFKYLTIDTK
ncbi:MAG: class I SAM-dependent methyltransferase [Cyanophyceae cyanobacterium]